MSPSAIIREALRALFRNKMRSGLTVLGPPRKFVYNSFNFSELRCFSRVDRQVLP